MLRRSLLLSPKVVRYGGNCVIVHTTAYMLRNSERGAQIRIRALREAALGADAWVVQQPWDPHAPWDSDGDDDDDMHS